MNKILCNLCNIYKSSHYFSKIGDSTICFLCHKLTLSYSNKYGKTYLVCCICKEKKIIGAFFRPTNVSNIKSKHICKICHLDKIQSEHSNFKSFIKKTHDNLKKSIKYYNHKYHHLELPFEITPNDIEQLYLHQLGRCSLTGRELTHQYYIERDSKIRYPDNMTIQMIDIKLGYVPANITLMCLFVSRNQLAMVKKLNPNDGISDQLIVDSPIDETNITKEENTDETSLEHIFDDTFFHGAELLLDTPIII